MKALIMLSSLVLATAASGQQLHLILVPQQLTIARGGVPTKFDVYLYNESKVAQSVPSLDTCTIFYAVRPTDTEKGNSESYTRKFSRPIKDHILKKQRTDHSTIEVDLGAKDGQFIEAYAEVGHGPVLRSNSVLLLCR